MLLFHRLVGFTALQKNYFSQKAADRGMAVPLFAKFFVSRKKSAKHEKCGISQDAMFRAFYSDLVKKRCFCMDNTQSFSGLLCLGALQQYSLNLKTWKE